LVVSVVPGKRTAEHVQELVQDFKRRTGGRLMNLLTSDEYSAYEGAILEAYGVVQEFPPTGRPGRPRQPITVPHPELKYATVPKTRENGRVVKVEPRVIFGTVMAVLAALAVSLVSKTVNTFFIERHNGTDRHHNSRKVRKSYGFSKDWRIHEAMTYFTMYSYNFGWVVRTLRVKGGDGAWQQRTPAMAAGLTDHVWSLQEWVTLPAVQH
jgi:IS1 family transposase